MLRLDRRQSLFSFGPYQMVAQDCPVTAHLYVEIHPSSMYALSEWSELEMSFDAYIRYPAALMAFEFGCLRTVH